MLNKRILVLVFVVAFVTLLVGCLPAKNEAPIITSDPVKTGEVGVPYTYDVNATDPDEDVLTYSLVTKPTNMSISSTTGLINWIPATEGNFSVVVKVSDGDLAITQSFTIAVSEEEEEPGVTPPRQYTITATADHGGSISPSGKIKVMKGSNKTFTITPDTNYLIADVLVDTNSEGAVCTYTFTNVTANHTIHATFKKVPIVINGILSPNEWDDATEIPVAGGMGTVRVLATVDYLYVAFDLVDSNDARTQYEGERGNDQISINVNPTHGGSWGFPYDLIFETSALDANDGGHHCLPWDSHLPCNIKVNSGTIDNWATRWFPNDAQETLPGDLESVTAYSLTNRVTEWKLPLASIAPVCGEHIKVGGAVDVGDGNSYVYPIGLDWGDASTFVDIVVY